MFCPCYFYFYFAMIVFTMAEDVPFSEIGKCYRQQGVKFAGTILKEIVENSADCCTSCHTFLEGVLPCTAYTLNIATSQCYLLSNVSSIDQDPTYTSGHLAQKLYKLSRKDAEPMSVVILSSPDVETESNCGLACLQHAECLSFSWMQPPAAAPPCKLFNMAETEQTTFQSLTGNKFYTIEYNFIANAVPIDCALSQWTEWTDCSAISENCQILACSCTKSRTRSIEQPAVHGGSDTACQEPQLEQIHPNETHVLILGGHTESTGNYQNSIMDFVPEKLTFTTLTDTLQIAANARNVGFWKNQVIVDGGWQGGGQASFEIFTGVPLDTISNAVIPKKRGAGCGGVASDKFYACYGIGAHGHLSPINYCDVYDLNNNYAHSVLDIAGTTGMYNVACVFVDKYMYVVGGSDGSTALNTFYQVNLMHGSAIALPNYNMTLDCGAAVLFQDNLVVCGGAPGIAQCRLYNYTSGEWHGFPEMNRGKFHVQIVNWGENKLLAIGGMYTSHSGYVSVKDVEVYEKGEWMQYTQMPQALDAVNAVNVGMFHP